MLTPSLDAMPADTVCGTGVRRGIPRGFPGLAAAIVVGLAAGCGAPQHQAASVSPAAAPAASPQTAGPPPAAPAVTVRLVDHAGLMKEVAAHLGTVVVLDCWSTSCPPCVEEFPGLVSLAERHGDRVACLSLAFDYDGSGHPQDLVPPIKTFLERIGAGRITNLLASEPADDLYRKLDLTSVPAVYVWKANGERAIRYDDELAARELGRPFTYEDVERTVAALLAEEATGAGAVHPAERRR